MYHWTADSILTRRLIQASFLCRPKFYRPKLFPTLIIAAFDQIGRIRAGKKRADKVVIIMYNVFSILYRALETLNPRVRNNCALLVGEVYNLNYGQYSVTLFLFMNVLHVQMKLNVRRTAASW